MVKVDAGNDHAYLSPSNLATTVYCRKYKVGRKIEGT